MNINWEMWKLNSVPILEFRNYHDRTKWFFCSNEHSILDISENGRLEEKSWKRVAQNDGILFRNLKNICMPYQNFYIHLIWISRMQWRNFLLKITLKFSLKYARVTKRVIREDDCTLTYAKLPNHAYIAESYNFSGTSKQRLRKNKPFLSSLFPP